MDALALLRGNGFGFGLGTVKTGVPKNFDDTPAARAGSHRRTRPIPMVTEKAKRLRGGADGPKVTALTEAYQCWSQGRRFLPATMGTVPAPVGLPYASA